MQQVYWKAAIGNRLTAIENNLTKLHFNNQGLEKKRKKKALHESWKTGVSKEKS